MIARGFVADIDFVAVHSPQIEGFARSHDLQPPRPGEANEDLFALPKSQGFVEPAYRFKDRTAGDSGPEKRPVDPHQHMSGSSDGSGGAATSPSRTMSPSS